MLCERRYSNNMKVIHKLEQSLLQSSTVLHLCDRIYLNANQKEHNSFAACSLNCATIIFSQYCSLLLTDC